MNRYLPSDRSLTRWDSMCYQGPGSRCSCSCPPSCQPVCPGPGPVPPRPSAPGLGLLPARLSALGLALLPARLSAPGPSRPSGPAPLAPPARRVSLDLTVPLALPALRVFPGLMRSRAKATSCNTADETGRVVMEVLFYDSSAIYDFKLSRSCFKILQQGAYLIGSHRLPVRLIFKRSKHFL